MRIAFLVNLIQNAPPLQHDAPPDALYELDDVSTLPVWKTALENAGHEIFFVEATDSLAQELGKISPDICFNTCEGHRGESREAQVPALLEMLGISYTAAGPLGMCITLHKPTTKMLLKYHGLPTPDFQLLVSGDEPLDPNLSFPLFCKPEHEGTGMGIGPESIIDSEKELRDRVSYLINAYRQPVLVERFIDGKDVTVGMVGNLYGSFQAITADPASKDIGLHLFPILEVDFSGYPPEVGAVFSARAKIDLAHDFRYHCPASLDEAQSGRLRVLATEAFRVTHCRDVARIDFRLDTNNHDIPYILDVNALPGLTAKSDLTTMAISDSWTHEDLIVAILNAARKRYGI